MKRALTAVAWILSIGILLESGVMMLVYLGRWQWNRSIIWGFIFIAALMVSSTALVIRSIARMDARSHGTDPLSPDMAVARALRESNLRRGPRFEWLQQDPNRLSVFLPVLLGAGLLLSTIAYAIERAAGAVAGGRLDRRTAAIIPLDLPMTTLPVAVAPARVPQRRHSRVGQVIGAMTVVLLVVAGAWVIRGLTLTIPDDITGPGSTTITVEVRTITNRPVEEIVVALWTVCAGTVSDHSPITSLVVDGQMATLTIAEGLRTTGKRRVIGCFEDLTLDRVKARVVELVVHA